MIDILDEILEALRGKTIIYSIILRYNYPVIDYDISELDVDSDATIKKQNSDIKLLFQPNFLTYVQWNYFSILEQVQNISGMAEIVEIFVHQLFEIKENHFILKFDENGVNFQIRKNIEDTLFFDLQRYCEHNKINYQVN